MDSLVIGYLVHGLFIYWLVNGWLIDLLVS